MKWHGILYLKDLRLRLNKSASETFAFLFLHQPSKQCCLPFSSSLARKGNLSKLTNKKKNKTKHRTLVHECKLFRYNTCIIFEGLHHGLGHDIVKDEDYIRVHKTMSMLWWRQTNFRLWFCFAYEHYESKLDKASFLRSQKWLRSPSSAYCNLLTCTFCFSTHISWFQFLVHS